MRHLSPRNEQGNKKNDRQREENGKFVDKYGVFKTIEYKGGVDISSVTETPDTQEFQIIKNTNNMEVYLNKSIDIVTVDHNWSKEEALRFVESNGIAHLDENIKAGFVLAMPRLATPGGFGETARIIDNGTGKRHMLHEFVDTPSLRKELWDHSGVIAMPLTESLDGDPMNIPLEVETRIRVMMANDGRIDEDSLINIHTVHPDGSETVEQETVGSMLKRLNEEETAARQAETSEQETRGIGAPTPGDSFDNWLKAQAVSEGALKKAEAFPDGSTLHERLIEDAQAAATAYTSALWKDTPDLDIFPEIDREAVIASIKGLYARGFDAEVLSDPRRRHIELDSPGEYGNQVAGDALRAWGGAVGPQPHLENIGDQIYKAVMAATAKEYERLNMYVRPTARMAPEAIQDAMDSFDDKIRARIKSVFDEEGFPLDELTATATPLERRGELLADLNRHADTVRKKIKEFLLETVDEREKIGLRTLYPSVVTKTFLKRLDTETREIMYLQGRFPKLENGQTLESVRAAIKETEVRLEKEESLYDRLSAGMGHSPGVPDTTDALRNELSALRALEKRYPDVSIKEPVNEGEKQEDVKKEQEQDTRAQEPSRAVGSQRKLPEQNPFMKGFNEGRNFFEGVLLGLINVFNEMFWASPEDDHFKLGTMPDAAAKEAAPPRASARTTFSRRPSPMLRR